jgi:hypothetical protein
MEVFATDPVLAACISVASGDGRTTALAVLRPRQRSGRDDPKERALTIYEFADTVQFANFESVLVQASPNHVYLSDNLPDADLRKAEGALEALEISSERVPKSNFTDDDVISQLQKLSGEAITSVESVRVLAA